MAIAVARLAAIRRIVVPFVPITAAAPGAVESAEEPALATFLSPAITVAADCIAAVVGAAAGDFFAAVAGAASCAAAVATARRSTVGPASLAA